MECHLEQMQSAELGRAIQSRPMQHIPAYCLLLMMRECERATGSLRDLCAQAFAILREQVELEVLGSRPEYRQ